MKQMLKYKDTKVVFQEIPGEISLAINLTGCPFLCPGCHSADLREDIGTELTNKETDQLIIRNTGISCIIFMGGDRYPKLVSDLASYIRKTHKIKVAWYSGSDIISPDIRVENFDYIKYGHYEESLGGLDSETTNQRLIKIEDITSKMYIKQF